MCGIKFFTLKKNPKKNKTSCTENVFYLKKKTLQLKDFNLNSFFVDI